MLLGPSWALDHEKHTVIFRNNQTQYSDTYNEALDFNLGKKLRLFGYLMKVGCHNNHYWDDVNIVPLLKYNKSPCLTTSIQQKTCQNLN